MRRDATLAEWPWSSVRAHLRRRDGALVELRPILGLVPRFAELLAMSPQEQKALDGFASLSRNGRPLGTPAFLAMVERKLRRSLRPGKPGPKLMEAAVEGARAHLRPILMTSFAFILGVAPLVVATGAGANARRSIGLTVFSGMIASTCLAVLFVPSFFVVVHKIARHRAKPALNAAADAPAE